MVNLSIVIPVFNEQEILPSLFENLSHELKYLKKELHSPDVMNDATIEVLFINDGSRDDSFAIIKSYVETHSYYRIINLSRNFGHQAAVSAGLKSARGQAVVVMDADLQDPPALIKDMVKQWKKGYHVVYAVRRKRQTKLMKNMAYKLYYKMKALMSDYPVQKDSGDFSLLDRKVVDIINQLPEKDRYMRGLRAWVGFRQVNLEYDRMDRKKGKSKYSFSGLVKLAFQGITSTSVKPLFISGLFSILSILIVWGIIIFAVMSKFYIPDKMMPRGWTSLMVTIAFLSGCQLVSIWLLSLYMAKIYREALSRPAYIIEYDSLAQDKAEAES